MGKLIAIVGNGGTGKTTLTQKLCGSGSFTALLEQHKERPFQKKFSSELRRFSLANQMDYLLFRAEQEIYVRQNDIIGVQDGGLDQDFHVFTKLFRHKGYLDEEEFQLCERLYSSLRQYLPTPDLFIWLSAPRSILIERRGKRKRDLDIAGSDDLEEMEFLIKDWLSNVSTPTLTIDTSVEDPSYKALGESLDGRIRKIMGIRQNFLNC